MLESLGTTPGIEAATRSDLPTVENNTFKLQYGGKQVLKMPPSTCNKKSSMLTENQEKENNGNATTNNKCSSHPKPHPHHGRSGAKWS
jgi:hypothetical protein